MHEATRDALPPMQEKVAINKEVLVAVSNSALLSGDGKFGMLKMWIDGVQRAGVKNFLIIAIDKTVSACDSGCYAGGAAGLCT